MPHAKITCALLLTHANILQSKININIYIYAHNEFKSVCKTQRCSACAAVSFIHAAYICTNIAKKKTRLLLDFDIWIRSQLFFNWLDGVNEFMESHDRKYAAHLSVLSRPAPHLVKARLPAYLSLSQKENKQDPHTRACKNTWQHVHSSFQTCPQTAGHR